VDLKDLVPALRGKWDKYTSLQPQENDLTDTGVETAAGFTPGLSQAMAVRDMARAWNDPAGHDYLGMGLAATGLVNAGGIVKALRGGRQNIIKDVYHGTPHDIPAGGLTPHNDAINGRLSPADKGLWFAENEKIANMYAQDWDGRAGNIHKVDLRWPDPAREAADPLGIHHFEPDITKARPLDAQTGHYQKSGADYGGGDYPTMSILDPALITNERKIKARPLE
jgi:hypothetical protein